MAVKEVFYRRELDCLRFFAFFIVFIFHFFPQHPEAYQRLGNHAANILSSLTLAGGLGVDLFFCLSSFLITTLLLREQATTGTVNVKAFWTRRMLRIWPLYYFFIAFTVFVVPYMLPEDDLKGWGLVGFLFFSGNWVCAFSGFPSTVACPLWSVSIEEQFYLLWPLVILLVGIRRLPHVAVLSLVVANVARIVATVYMDPQHPAIWCNTFTRLDPIAMGALLAVFCIRKQFSLSNRVRVIVATLSLIPIPASFLFLGKPAFSSVASIWFYPLASVCCVALLVAVYDNGINATGWNRSWYVDIVTWLGRISYGLYVYHSFPMEIAKDLFPILTTGNPLQTGSIILTQLAFTVVVTVLLAAISYEFLEKPFLRIKDRFSVVSSTPTSEGAAKANGSKSTAAIVGD